MDMFSLREKAVKYIGLSKKTCEEVKQKLKRLGADDEVAEQIVNDLTKLGYLNDIEYIKAYVRQSEKTLAYSVYEISQKLRAKGISNNDMEEIMDSLLESEYEIQVIQKLYMTKLKNCDEQKRKAYLYAHRFVNKEVNFGSYTNE